MKRLSDWRPRLAEAIAARRHVPFVWGVADCCLTAAELGRAMTGEDFAAPLRGYRSRFGALRRLKSAGHDSLAAYLDTLFARTGRARIGDAVVVRGDPLGPLWIADGRGGAWGQDAHGLARFAIPDNAMIWSV